MLLSRIRVFPPLLLAGAAVIALLLAPGPSSVESAGPAEHLVVLAPGASEPAYRHLVDHVQAGGGDLRLEYPPAAFTAVLDSASRDDVASHAGVSLVSAKQVDDSGLTGPARTAALAWNSRFSDVAAAAGDDQPAFVPDGDVRIAPEPPAMFTPMGTVEAAAGPTNSQTSEYMAGSIVVSVVFVESTGGPGNCTPADAQTENWDASRQTTALNEISAGVSFWLNRTARPSPLSFTIDNQGTRGTSCEPINRSDADESRWIADALTNMGFPANTGNYRDVARGFADARRDALGADWGYTIFLVDSLNDADGLFTNGGFAYAYLNGPFMVMTYDNNGWGINRMNLVTAHETGHIFGALDEYPQSNCTTADSWGYLNALNTSCNNGGDITDLSIMGPSAEQNNANVDVSSSARAAIGWRNPSANTTSAVVDVVRNSAVTLGAYSPDPTTDSTPTYTGSATNIPYPPAGPRMRSGQARGTASPVSIARVANVEWSVDGGPYTATGSAAVDGAFDEETDAYTFTPAGSVGGGAHVISARAVNHFGHASDELTDPLTVICVVSNDCFADALSITGPLPYSGAQDTTGTTREAAEPLVQTGCGPSADDMDTTAWYRYTPAFAQTLRADTFGSGYDTRLAVHTGASLSSLSLVACNDNSGDTEQSGVSFLAAAGTTYHFQVDGFGGATGDLAFNLAQVLPDLHVESVTLDPPVPAAGHPAAVSIGVQNLGGYLAGSAYVDFYAQSVLPPDAVPGDFRCTITTLGAGSSTLCEGTVTYETPGQYSLWSQVDLDGIAVESDESNNIHGPQLVDVIADADLDGATDTIDNCPDWPNPSQALPVLWNVPPDDSDCDGYSDAREAYLGTDPARHCAADTSGNNEPGPDGWPMDMNDDRRANSLDIGVYVFTLNLRSTNEGFLARHDLNGNGTINTLDVGAFVFVLNATCG